jgi:hypothetical protein
MDEQHKYNIQYQLFTEEQCNNI